MANAKSDLAKGILAPMKFPQYRGAAQGRISLIAGVATSDGSY